jgi:hypothetical protein
LNNVIGKVLAATGILAGAMGMTPAQAAPTYCNGSNVAPVTGNAPVVGSTVQGTLEVAAGDICIVDGITVTGSVIVDPGAFLGIENSTIRGSFTTEGTSTAPAAFVTLNVTIDGNASVAGGGAGPDVSAFCQSALHGNVVFRDNSETVILGDPTIVLSAPFSGNCTGNTVTGSVSATDNSGQVGLEQNTIKGAVTASGNGAVAIEDNTIGGTLSCSGNTIVAGQGTNNVHGRESGQCKGF